jgi:TPR repeat protein
MVLVNFVPIAGPIIAIANLGFCAGKPGTNRFDPTPPAATAVKPPHQAPMVSVEVQPPPVETNPPAQAAVVHGTAPSRKRRWRIILGAAVVVAAGVVLQLTGVITQVRASLGDKDACQDLAWQYREGRRRSQDILKAVEWFEKAAAKGAVKAEYDLGILYYYGIGVSEDRDQAGTWFRTAADAGYAPAMLMSGVLLEDETPDNNEARLQDPWAESLLGSAYLSRFSRTEDTDDIVAALYWMESAHRHGVEPVGGLLQHVWANLAPDIQEEVTESVFKHLEEGPPDIAGDEQAATDEETGKDSNAAGMAQAEKTEDSTRAAGAAETEPPDDKEEK